MLMARFALWQGWERSLPDADQLKEITANQIGGMGNGCSAEFHRNLGVALGHVLSRNVIDIRGPQGIQAHPAIVRFYGQVAVVRKAPDSALDGMDGAVGRGRSSVTEAVPLERRKRSSADMTRTALGFSRRSKMMALLMQMYWVLAMVNFSFLLLWFLNFCFLILFQGIRGGLIVFTHDYRCVFGLITTS